MIKFLAVACMALIAFRAPACCRAQAPTTVIVWMQPAPPVQQKPQIQSGKEKADRERLIRAAKAAKAEQDRQDAIISDARFAAAVARQKPVDPAHDEFAKWKEDQHKIEEDADFAEYKKRPDAYRDWKESNDYIPPSKRGTVEPKKSDQEQIDDVRKMLEKPLVKPKPRPKDIIQEE